MGCLERSAIWRRSVFCFWIVFSQGRQVIWLSVWRSQPDGKMCSWCYVSWLINGIHTIILWCDPFVMLLLIEVNTHLFVFYSNPIICVKYVWVVGQNFSSQVQWWVWDRRGSIYVWHCSISEYGMPLDVFWGLVALGVDGLLEVIQFFTQGKTENVNEVDGNIPWICALNDQLHFKQWVTSALTFSISGYFDSLTPNFDMKAITMNRPYFKSVEANVCNRNKCYIKGSCENWSYKRKVESRRWIAMTWTCKESLKESLGMTPSVLCLNSCYLEQLCSSTGVGFLCHCPN